MKLKWYTIAGCLFCIQYHLFAQTGDTLEYTTHDSVQLTYTGWYNTVVAFPDTITHYRKVLLHVTVGRYDCPGNPQYCGSWDYLSDVYASKVSGGDTLDIARYITPYAGGYPPGWSNESIYDITDYAPLLHDSVRIRYNFGGYSYGFTITLRFEFITGTPPQDVVNVHRLWSGEFTWNTGGGSNDIENYLQPITEEMDSPAVNTKLRFQITSHGEDNENCAEFCYKHYYIYVGSQQVFTHQLDRICGSNQLYPQYGSWIYERANWCPGEKVYPNDFDLTPYLHQNTSYPLNVDMEKYQTVYTNGASPAYVDIEGQLFTYKNPNFSLDASLEDIIAPNVADNQFRSNPICDNPIVVIRNNGSTPLTSLTINYGIKNGSHVSYYWGGYLTFLQQDTVVLYNDGSIFPKDTTGTFEVSISNPNGQQDEYSANDYISSTFETPMTLPSQFVVNMKTNSETYGNTNWYVIDSYNDTLFKRENVFRNTIVNDTVLLAQGCYHLVVTDGGCDGLYNGFYDGTGYLYVLSLDKKIKYNLPHYKSANFGCGFTENFSAENVTGIQETDLKKFFEVFPNPSSGIVKIVSHLQQAQTANLFLINQLGQQVYSSTIDLGETSSTLDLSKLPDGIYDLHISMKEGFADRLIVIGR